MYITNVSNACVVLPLRQIFAIFFMAVKMKDILLVRVDPSMKNYERTMMNDAWVAGRTLSRAPVTTNFLKELRNIRVFLQIKYLLNFIICWNIADVLIISLGDIPDKENKQWFRQISQNDKREHFMRYIRLTLKQNTTLLFTFQRVMIQHIVLSKA